MPRGDKSKYTDKEKRQAEHIEEGYEKRGVPENEAERRGWATVNKVRLRKARKSRTDEKGRTQRRQPLTAISRSREFRRFGRRL